ncbi:putative O-glycosylation ligase, exosortase A system-associated [Marinobacter sp. 1_MG-2023]|uniref:putative O-glycosylation ligase, exosortase A system-associated n=1 Tax=Marinobacter sp. 1_MG-2023 TaxID=3062627 RepID=UPI0026E11F7B|nr:putative O-glycosylation ligase, exosortase A system-associated [Marinobacter sp. 1_MG-2023]MDO6824575.1 putative O-glycosylation ligase, exosortase A system-associated [Marinobacter sp. 1_MG-2023]
MLSDILWIFTIGICALLGLRSPYLALYTVIFIDILKPQNLSYGFLANASLSLLLTSILAFSILINIKKLVLPKKIGITILLIFFVFWITYTTSIAQFPGPAWFKYDYVIKTIAMTIVIPFIINTRLKMEIVVCAMVVGVSYYVVIGGVRTALGQGGYGMPLVPTRLGDSEIVETSTLSMIAVFTIPLLIYIRNHSLFRNKIRFLKHICIFLIACCLLTILGTYARTGLIGLFILFFLFFLSSRHKLKIAVGSVVAAACILVFVSDDYLSRMQTLENATEDSSALGRILVWKWTIDYVKDRPITGGGFDSFRANTGQLNQYLPNSTNIEIKETTPKAFHNVFFEVLGEQGYIGLLVYMLLIYRSWYLNWKLSRDENCESSLRNLATVLHQIIIIYCVCGMFIGVAYAPWIFYFIGISSALQNVTAASSEAPSSSRGRKSLSRTKPPK